MSDDLTPTEQPIAPPPLEPDSDHTLRNVLIALGAILLLAGVGAGGWLLGHGPQAKVISTPSPTATAAPTQTPTATPSTNATQAPATATAATCGPFDHPLDALDAPSSTVTPGGEGSGCDNGTVPNSGTPFSVPANWGWSSAITCSGDAGPGGMGDVLDITAHNTDTNTDLAPVNNDGTWSHGGSVADGNGGTAPAGHYILRVTLAHPGANHCQWHIRVENGPG